MKTRNESKRRKIPAQTKAGNADEKMASAANLLHLAKRFGDEPRKGRGRSVDLSGLHELAAMKDFVEKFLGGQLPSRAECSDAAELAYKRTSSLLFYCDDADMARESTGPYTEPIEGWVLDSVRLQVEMLYVVHKRLLEISERATASIG